jgi:hypothetical protein
MVNKEHVTDAMVAKSEIQSYGYKKPSIRNIIEANAPRINFILDPIQPLGQCPRS